MFYVTGDTHRKFDRISFFCNRNGTTLEDTIIILGDVCINYCGQRVDDILKNQLSLLPINLFCIHGNHEQRPQTIRTYKEKEMYGGLVFYEEKYPNLIFAKDGQIYDFGGNRSLVIGGAYSPDKVYRLQRRQNWWPDEQPSEVVKEEILNKIPNENIDIILSHTCPYRYLPREAFIKGVDQSLMDQSTERFLDVIEKEIDYKKWYCGHFHIDKEIDKVEFMHQKIKTLSLK